MARGASLSTQVGWVTGLIKGLGGAISPNTLGAVTAWTNAEGVWGSTGGSVVNNPLGITMSFGVPTTGVFNSDGVLEFATPAQGLQATIAFIKNRTPTIATALQDNATAPQLYGVVNSTGWAGAGGYPTPWVGGTPSRSRLPGGTTSSSGSSMYTRPGGQPSGQASSSITDILSGWTTGQDAVPPVPSGVQTTGLFSGVPILGSIPLVNDIPNPLDLFTGLSDGINGIVDFLKLLAWIINPVNILRMVEFLLGVGIMAFGIQAAIQGHGESAEGFDTGEAAISRSGLGRVSRELAAGTKRKRNTGSSGGVKSLKPAPAPHRVRRTALRVRYEREQNVASRRTSERRNPKPKAST